MKELQTNGLTIEQELERYKSWLEDLHIRYDELKNEHSTTEKELEELERDVKRYIELVNNHNTTSEENNEWYILREKLSKVGTEHD